jgi:hypothetical protein
MDAPIGLGVEPVGLSPGGKSPRKVGTRMISPLANGWNGEVQWWSAERSPRYGEQIVEYTAELFGTEYRVSEHGTVGFPTRIFLLKTERADNVLGGQLFLKLTDTDYKDWKAREFGSQWEEGPMPQRR